MEADELELFDPDTAGFLIEGLTAMQIRKLKAYYQHFAKDIDLDHLMDNTKNL